MVLNYILVGCPRITMLKLHRTNDISKQDFYTKVNEASLVLAQSLPVTNNCSSSSKREKSQEKRVLHLHLTFRFYSHVIVLPTAHWWLCKSDRNNQKCWEKQKLLVKGHLTFSQAPLVCEKNTVHFFYGFTQPGENST